MRTNREILETYYNKARVYDSSEQLQFQIDALNNFETFFHCVIGHEVGPYHRILFNLLQHDRLCIMSPRGHAKTEIFSVCYVLWRAIKQPNKEMVIISATDNQSMRIIRRIRMLIESNEFLMEFKPRGKAILWSKSELTLKNRTRIVSSPFTDTVRGNRIDLCVCDDILKKELSEQSPSITKFFEIVEPAVDTENSQLIVVGTPQSNFDLLHVLSEEGSGYHFKKFQCCAALDGTQVKGPVLFPERWNIEKLQQRFHNMGMAAFMQEYMCIPIQPGDIIFDYETMIKPNIDEDIEPIDEGIFGNTYYLGVDIALSSDRSADSSAYIVLEKRPGDTTYRVVHMTRPAKGTPTDMQINMIKELNNKFKFNTILVENKGNSMSLVEALQTDMETAGITRDFKTTHSEKERIVLKIQGMLANGYLNMYPESHLINELKSMGIKHQIRAGRSFEKIESLTGHDDTVMALALAVEAATSPLGQVGAMWV